MPTVAILSKPQKRDLATLLPQLILWLKARGHRVVLDPVSGNYTHDAEIVAREDMPALRPDLAIVLGGDGTLLAAARVFATEGVPLLSVNLGSLGFLTEVSLAQMYPTLEAWCRDCGAIDRRMMLRAVLQRSGETIGSFDALNDVVISKGAIARMANFSIQLDGSKVAAYRADGVIVATPTGSTAYSLAANGPILSPHLDAMVITPVCPHILTIRPLVVNGDSRLVVTIEGVPDQTYLTIDGQEAVLLALGDEIHCHRSEHEVKLLRLGDNGFFDVLRQKLKWGER